MNGRVSCLYSLRFGIVGVFCGAALFFFGCRQDLSYVQRSQAMAPTIAQDTTVSVDPLAYQDHGPNRWDLVVFRYPLATNSLFAMRIVGLSGESILLDDAKIFVNGSLLEVPSNLTNIVCAVHPGQGYASPSAFHIPAGHVFVLGDNARQANDSRFWGALSEDLIVGKITTLHDWK